MVRTTLLLFFLCFSKISFAQIKDVELLNKVLRNLEIDKNNFYSDLVVITSIPSSSDEVLIFIPEISEKTENYMGFKAHLLIVDNESGTIESSYSEDKWLYNDAIVFDKVKIRFNDIEIASNKNSIILEITQSNSSRIFPYSGKYISIFIRENESLKLLLKDYMVESFNGETNMGCEGEFIEHKRTIKSLFKENTNFFDLKVVDSITTTAVNKDCNDESVVLDISKQLLNFKNGQYIQAKN